MESTLTSTPELAVGIIVLVLLGIWVVGVVRKIGGCLVHFALLGAGLVILYYLVSIFQAGG